MVLVIVWPQPIMFTNTLTNARLDTAVARG